MSDGGEYSTVIPQITNAGDYSIKVKIENANYQGYISDDLTAVINKVLVSYPTIENKYYTGSLLKADMNIQESDM